MAAAVGALNVSLGLNPAQFQTGLRNAQSGLQRFQMSAAKIGAAIGASLASIAGGFAMGVRSAANAADEMAKASQKVGVGTEALSGLKHAADLAGVGFQDLQTGLIRLSRSMSEAVEKPTSQAGRAFAALGVQVKNADGSLKSSSQVLSEVASKFASYRDGAEKTALAVQLFGRAGANMIPLLNSGAAGLSSAADEARKLGLVIREDTARAAEGFNDNLTRLSRVISGGFLQILAQVAPMMETLTNAFVNAATNASIFERAGEAVARMLDSLARYAATTVKELQAVVAVFNYVKETASGIGTGFFDNQAAAANKMRDSLRKAGEQYDATIKKLDAPKSTFGALNTGVKFNQVQGMDALKAALEPKLNAPAIQGVEKAAKGAKQAVEKLTEAEREAARLYQKLKTEAESLYESTRTPLEAFRDQMEKLQKMLVGEGPNGTKNPMISQETFTRAALKAQEDLNKALIAGSEYAQSMLSSLNGMFSSFLEGTFKLSDALNKLWKDFAKIAMNKALTNLLGALMSGGTGGSGFSIMGLKIPGFASGGRYSGGPMIVGERGPELLVPDSSGTVIPNHALGGGRTNVQFVVENHGAQVEQREERGADGSTVLRAIVRSVVLEDIGKNGPIGQGFQGRYGLNRARGR